MNWGSFLWLPSQLEPYNLRSVEGPLIFGNPPMTHPEPCTADAGASAGKHEDSVKKNPFSSTGPK